MFGFFSKFLAPTKGEEIYEPSDVFPLTELPTLVLERTLDYLSYEDLFALRRTCKWWKELIDQRKFRRLILFIDAYPSPKRLFYSNQMVGYSNSLRITDLTALETANFQRTFANLHTLAIFYDPPTVDNLVSHLTIDLALLDCYRQLEFLSIDLVGFVCGALRNLQKLKVCYVKARLQSTNFSLAGCSELQALAVLEYARPEPASVFRKVTCLYLDSMLDLQNFESLQVLYFGLRSTMEKTLDQLQSGQLSLPALREVRMLDWASCYFGRESFLEKLRSFEVNERTKHVKIFLGDRPIDGVADLQRTLELIRSFDAGPKYFGAVLNADYLAFLHRHSDQLSLLFPFVRKLVIEHDLEFPGTDKQIRELPFENLEMLVLRSSFTEPMEHLRASENLGSEQLKSPASHESQENGRVSSASSVYSSCNSSCNSSRNPSPRDNRSTDHHPPTYRASELFFKFWIKRWPRIRFLELENYFSQADFDSLTCLLNLKNLTLVHYRPDDLTFVTSLKNLTILQFKQHHLQPFEAAHLSQSERPKAILTEKEFVFLFKQAPSLRELHLYGEGLLLKVAKRDQRHYELIKCELNIEKPVKITEFHSVNMVSTYALRKFSQDTVRPKRSARRSNRK